MTRNRNLRSCHCWLILEVVVQDNFSMFKPILIPSQPTSHIVDGTKKPLAQSQHKHKNSPNQKTNRPHNLSVRWEKSYTICPTKNKKENKNETISTSHIDSLNNAKGYIHPHLHPHTTNIAPRIVCGANQMPHTPTEPEKKPKPKNNPFQSPQCGVQSYNPTPS